MIQALALPSSIYEHIVPNPNPNPVDQHLRFFFVFYLKKKKIQNPHHCFQKERGAAGPPPSQKGLNPPPPLTDVSTLKHRNHGQWDIVSGTLYPFILIIIVSALYSYSPPPGKRRQLDCALNCGRYSVPHLPPVYSWSQPL